MQNKLDWERDSQPCNGSVSICLHKDTGLSISKPKCGEWTNVINGCEYEDGDVVGWMSIDSFPLHLLPAIDLVDLLRNGVTTDRAITRLL